MRRLYVFDQFSLSPDERRLTRDGADVHIRAKAFDTLLYLLENQGKLVRREELLNSVWKGVVVEASNIDVAIHDLRKILGRHVIQNVWGQGYRLIVNVNIVIENGKQEDDMRIAGFNPNSHPRPLRVFLCHSSTDKPAVRKLFQRLRNNGIDPWLDEEKLLPGQNWDQEIPKAVRSCDIVIVCLSRGAITKTGYVQKEIRYALDIADEQPDGTIFLIPLKLEQCDMPDRLRRWQWVNLFENTGYERLMRALEYRSSQIASSDPR